MRETNRFGLFFFLKKADTFLYRGHESHSSLRTGWFLVNRYNWFASTWAGNTACIT